MSANGDRVSFWDDGNVLELDRSHGCDIVNVLTAIELYILKW